MPRSTSSGSSGAPDAGALRDGLRRLRALVLRWRVRLSARKVGLALVYHGLDEPGGDPERRLLASHSIGRFESHVQHLSRRYRPVRASEFVAAVAARRRLQRPPVCITFDDDLRSHVEVAAPTLERHGLRGTFFLNAGWLESRRRPWWVLLDESFERNPGRVEEALAGAVSTHRPFDLKATGLEIERLEPDNRDDVETRLRQISDPEPSDWGLTEGDVAKLAAAGHEIGFHTRRHDRLPELDDADLQKALTEGRKEIEVAAGATMTAIAYPHGRSSRRVATAARRSGLRFGYTTDADRLEAGDDPLLIGRYWPSYGSAAHFSVEVAQLLAGRWGSG